MHNGEEKEVRVCVNGLPAAREWRHDDLSNTEAAKLAANNGRDLVGELMGMVSRPGGGCY